MISILPEPGVALPCKLTAGYSLLSADSGAQESKIKCTPVTHKRIKAKKKTYLKKKKKIRPVPLALSLVRF